MIHVPSERGFPFIPDRMDQTTLCLPMSSVREGRVENHLSPVQNVRPVFMTAVRIRNFRHLTAAAASFDAITEHFRTWNPQVSAYVVIVWTPAGGGPQTSSAVAEAHRDRTVSAAKPAAENEGIFYNPTCCGAVLSDGIPVMSGEISARAGCDLSAQRRSPFTPLSAWNTVRNHACYK